MIFDFRTEDTYKNVDFWVETYKNGKLVDSRAASTNVLNTNYNTVANAYCSMIQPVEIEDGKEIVVYACVF